MNCSECQELLSEYIDGDIAEKKHGIVYLHLQSCSECNMICQDLEQIVQVSRDLPLLAPQNALWKQIEAEIKELTQPGYKPHSMWARFWNYRVNLSISMPQLAGALLSLLFISVLASAISYLPQQALLSSAD